MILFKHRKKETQKKWSTLNITSVLLQSGCDTYRRTINTVQKFVTGKYFCHNTIRTNMGFIKTFVFCTNYYNLKVIS